MIVQEVTTGAELDPGAPLDARQLARIEHVHRGFLYQHVYAARTLLGLRGTDAVLVVEHDEDVEVLWPDRHAYVQVSFALTDFRVPRSPRCLRASMRCGCSTREAPGQARQRSSSRPTRAPGLTQ